jgi:hypothetical protein
VSHPPTSPDAPGHPAGSNLTRPVQKRFEVTVIIGCARAPSLRTAGVLDARPPLSGEAARGSCAELPGPPGPGHVSRRTVRPRRGNDPVKTRGARRGSCDARATYPRTDRRDQGYILAGRGPGRRAGHNNGRCTRTAQEESWLSTGSGRDGSIPSARPAAVAVELVTEIFTDRKERVRRDGSEPHPISSFPRFDAGEWSTCRAGAVPRHDARPESGPPRPPNAPETGRAYRTGSARETAAPF